MNNRDALTRKQTMMRQLEQDYSCTMCTAKWLQSTITLHNGRTHSCCHSPSHKIPLDELAKSPSALHNTSFKKQVRAQLLAGEKPADCNYCWDVEAMSDNLSARYYRSTNTEWSQPYLSRLADEDVVPSYIEVAFDSTCNFKCAYCGPDLSSKWMEEIEQYGAYPTSWQNNDLDQLRNNGRFPIPHREANPYIEAFWQWFPTVRDKLRVFRITGGEPLLSKHTWRVIDDLLANPPSNLTFAINTNMGVPDGLIDRLITNYQRLAPKLRQFQLYTSCEAIGRQAEYIRFGMDYDKFIGNVRRFLTETHGSVCFMMTVNALSLSTFDQFLQLVYDLRCEFNTSTSINRVPMSVNILRWPVFQDVRVVPQPLRLAAAERCRAVIEARTLLTSPDPMGRFYLEEIDQIEQLIRYLQDDLPELQRARDDFAAFFKEYDRRRHTDFATTFPDLAALL